MGTSIVTRSVLVIMCIAKAVTRRKEHYLPFECTPEDVEKYYPCGNAKDFHNRFNIKFIQYDQIGEYCVGNSAMSGRGIRHRTFNEARYYCQEEGGELVEFSDNSFWNAYKNFYSNDRHRHKQDSNSWIRGRRGSGAGIWYWADTNSPNLFYDNDTRWDGGEPNNEAWNEECVTMSNLRWCDYKCDTKLAFICRMNIISSYYSKFRFHVVQATPENGTYKVGDRLEFTCFSRAKEGLLIEVSTADGRKYTMNSENTATGDISEMNIYGYSVPTNERSFYGVRCYVYINVRFFANLNLKWNGAKATCRTIGQPVNQTYTIYVEYKVRKPRVHFHKFGEGFIPLGTETNYKCEALMGSGDVMTLAILQAGVWWARTYKIDGAEEEMGEQPSWLEDVIIETDSGRDDRRGGNYITVTMKFKMLYAMDETFIGCHSMAVLDKIKARKIKVNSMDYYGDYRTVGVRESLIKPEITYDTGLRVQAGKIPVHGCNPIKVTCKGRVGKSIGLAFEILTMKKPLWVYKLSSHKPVQLLPWIKLTKVQEYVDYELGPTVELGMDMIAGPEFFSNNFSCKTTNYNGQMPAYKSPNFQPIHINMPPNLEPKDLIIGVEDPVHYLLLTCETMVGKSDIMTWEMEDYKGRLYQWFVHKVDGIRKIGSVDNVQVERKRATTTVACGPVIISTLKYLKGTSKRGATFTCVSYDLSTGEFDSTFSKENLSRKYELYGGGGQGDVDFEEDVLPWLYIGVIGLLALIAGIGFVKGQNPFKCLFHAVTCKSDKPPSEKVSDKVDEVGEGVDEEKKTEDFEGGKEDSKIVEKATTKSRSIASTKAKSIVSTKASSYKAQSV